jgi:hypothetical protein
MAEIADQILVADYLPLDLLLRVVEFMSNEAHWQALVLSRVALMKMLEEEWHLELRDGRYLLYTDTQRARLTQEPLWNFGFS